MSTIKIDFTIQYVDCNLSINETHPSLVVYLDSNVKRSYTKDVAVLPLHPENVEKKIGGKVSGFVSTRVPRISPTTSLCFASYAWVTNDGDVECRADAGTADVLLSDIVDGRPSKTQPFIRDIPLVMHTTSNHMQKGVVRLSVSNVDMGHVLFTPHRVEADSRSIGDELSRYYQGIAEQRAQLGDAIPGTSRVDAPYNYSESGFRGTPVPLLGYMLHELPEVNTEMFVHGVEVAMRRDGMRTTDFHLLNDEGKQRVLINMLMLVPTYGDYLGDTVQTDSRKTQTQFGVKHEAPAEKFGARLGDAGDCEDFGGQIVQMHEAFNAHPIPAETAQHAPLRELQRISRQLISYVNLAIVNGAQVNQEAAVGAHMYALFEGWRNWKERLEQTADGRRISAQLPYPDGVDEMPHHPLAIGEGTGIHEPLGYDTDLTQIMGAVNALPSLSGFKKLIWHPRDKAVPFYIGSVMGATGYFAKRGSTYGTWLMTDAESGKRGARIENMICGNFGMVMQPKLGKRLMQVTREAAYKREPVPPMLLTQQEEKAEKHPELQRIQHTVASWGRVDGKKRHVAIPVYVRPYQVTKRVADAMISDFKRSTHITRITSHLERITDDIYGYRVMIHVNVDKYIK